MNCLWSPSFLLLKSGLARLPSCSFSLFLRTVRPCTFTLRFTRGGTCRPKDRAIFCRSNLFTSNKSRCLWLAYAYKYDLYPSLALQLR